MISIPFDVHRHGTYFIVAHISYGFVFFLVILSFLIGSIPFGLIVSRLFYNKDIRKSGSGNIGAMNALRTLGTAGAIAVLILDAVKGFGMPFLAMRGSINLALLLAAAAIIGHCFSPWLRLKGGKGVATSLGALFALCWPAGIVAVLVWIVGALTTTYSSVGSILAHLSIPLALWYFTRDPWATAYGALAALLILYTHRENLARLRAGKEQGISFLRRGQR